MAKEDPVPPALVGRAGLVFAYVCFTVAIVALISAISILPLDLRSKLFLSAAAFLVGSLFVFMAIAAHLVSRSASKSGRKATPPPEPGGADGSQRPR